ncbi:protein Dos2p [Trichomonascus vanleenenianus]|uniref:Dos2p n=1 Tax=Trichomonascus vanleenenianus TaxID=2268995 RepID=UPI003ECAB574
MDFVYDKIQVEGVVTPKPEEKVAEETPIDKAADRLENELEKAFTKVTDKNSWSSWWSTVKQKGELALNETKKDLESVRQEIGTLLAEQSKPAAGPSSEESKETKDTHLNDSTETITADGEAPTNSHEPTMLTALSQKAQTYIDELDRDLEKIENKAGSYLSQVGSDLRSFLKDAVTVSSPVARPRDGFDPDAGEDAPSEVLFNVPEDIRNQIYSTRLDAQLHALHTSKEPFLVKTSEDDGYNKFAADFDVDKKTDQIAKDLEEHPSLRKLMEQLVPSQVSYNEFWTKYYYMRGQIAQQEEKRKLLVQQATTNNANEEDVSWDDEDEEEEAAAKPEQEQQEEEKVEEPKTCTSSRPSSESSYDLVSKNSSNVDLKKAADNDDDDSDDDWE